MSTVTAQALVEQSRALSRLFPNKLRLFLIISVGLHAMFGVSWGVPEYVHYAAREAQRRENEELQELRRSIELKTREDDERRKLEATKKDVLDELRHDFARIVQSELSKPDQQSIWNKVSFNLNDNLQQYARELSDPSVSDGELEAHANDLKREMVNEMLAALREMAAEQYAYEFMQSVENHVMPAMAEHYRKQIERLIGTPLQRDGSKLIHEEVLLVERERNEMTHALEAAIREAEAACKELTAIRERIEKAETAATQAGTAGEDPPGPKALIAAVRSEVGHIARLENTLKGAEGRLRKAAESAALFGEELKDQIAATAENEAQGVKTHLGDARKAAKEGSAPEARHEASESAEAAKALADAARAAKEAAEAAQFDPGAQARAVLKDLRDKELKRTLQATFDKNFEQNALPRMTEKLGAAFKQALETAGIDSEPTVRDVQAKVHETLKRKLPALTAAGEAATAALNKAENLDGARASDNKNELRAKSLTEKLRALGNSGDEALAGITTDARADEAFVTVAREHGPPQGPEARRKRSSAGAVAHGEGTGDAEGSDLTSVLERVANTAANVNAGRMGFLDSSHAGAHGEGAGQGLGLGTGTGPGGPGGIGLGNAGSGGEWGLGGLARLRRNALERGHGAFRSTRFSNDIYFDPQQHAQLTAGIHDRDQKAAQGDHWERKASEGETASAAGKDALRYKRILLPAQPPAEVTGGAQKKDPYKPSFKTINFAAIPFLHSAIQLDGDLNEWKDVPALQLRKNGNKPHPGKKVVEPQLVKVGWNNTGLYFAYDVQDADGQITKVHRDNFWEGDCVEIWFDTRNTKDKFRGASWAQQFWIWPFGQSGDERITGGEAIINDPAKSQPWKLYTAKELQRSARHTQEGWTLEVHIPAAQINELNLQPGRIMGFNLSICTGTEVYYYWAGTSQVRTSERPDTWGDILISGSDSKLELPTRLATELKAGESAGPARALIIGEPLRVRVTDADMNLSDARREKLSVTAKTSGGETLLAILEETAASSGVFEGAIATSLNIGDRAAGVLALFEGETVSVVYVDQARSNGGRNVEIKLGLKVASGVVETMGSFSGR